MIDLKVTNFFVREECPFLIELYNEGKCYRNAIKDGLLHFLCKTAFYGKVQ